MNAATERGEQFYKVHGWTLAVSVGDESFRGPLETLLWPFVFPPEDEPRFRLRLVAESPPDEPLPGDARLVFSHRESPSEDPLSAGLDFEVYRADDLVQLDLGEKGIIRISLSAGSAEAYFPDPSAVHADALGSLIMFTLAELLKTVEIYMIHAGSVSLEGRGVLIPGTQGRGKSTLCLTLVEGGFGFLTDDVSLLRTVGESVEFLEFPERVSVSENTIALIPHLQTMSEKMEVGLLKRHFNIDDVYPGARTARADTGLILFPEVSGLKQSRLESLPPTRAMENLMPQAISVLDVDTAREQFALLSKLVSESDCYKIYLGKDLVEIPKLVADALDRKSCPSR